MIIEGEIKDAKMSIFHLISKHSFNISFALSQWIADKFEK